MLCQHCSANSTPYLNTFISFEKASQIIKEAAGLGLEILSFTGGEPLIHPRLTDMIQLADSLGVKDIRIFTSGLKFRNSRIEPMDVSDVESLAMAGLKRVFFNLQGASAEIHERITLTPGSFAAVMSGSKLCKRHDLYVGFHFVPMKPNWRELTGLVAIGRELDIDEIGVLRFVPQGRGALNRRMLEPSSEEFNAFQGLASRLIREGGKPKLRLGCPFNSIAELIPSWEAKPCPAASEMCHILINGTVTPCSAFKHEDNVKAGNIYQQTLTDLWREAFPAFTAQRQKMAAEYDCTAQRILSRRNVTTAQVM